MAIEPSIFTIQLAEALQEKFPLQNLYGRDENVFTISPGRKYDVISRDGSSYVIVDRETGEVCKSAGYGRPAKRKDGSTFGKYFCNTAESLSKVIRNADRFGSFLYNDYKPV